MKKILKIFKSLLILPLLFSANSFALSFDDAKHLLNRSGFNSNLQNIERLLELDKSQAVDAIIDSARTTVMTPIPDGITEIVDRKKIKALSDEQRKKFMRERRANAVALKSWWYQEMITTDSPLTEHMTLFWHNHFTSSIKKVKSLPLIYKQNVMLRKYALGNFRELLHEVISDPAMLVYLDNINNRKQRPNENLARELLELFTLGEGNYTEQDIKQVALSLAGRTVNRQTGKFRVVDKWQDNSDKLFLGQQGDFNGDDIVEIILQQPVVAEFIVNKLWKEFISPEPDEQEVARLAIIFRTDNYQIKPLMRAIFNSPYFWVEDNRAVLIKSPVELLVGLMRTLNLKLPNNKILTKTGRALGQDIFDPPNVKGWQGGNAWITSDSLSLRNQVIARLIKSLDDKRKQINMATSEIGLSKQKVIALLLPTMPVTVIDERGEIIDVIKQCLADPVYQLK